MVAAVKPSGKPHATRKGIPLALLIARYFGYVVLALGLVWAGLFAALSLMFAAGVVYPANYGPSHSEEVAKVLRDSSQFSAQLVPTPYRYLLCDSQGRVLQTDMPQDDAAAALAALNAALGEGAAASDLLRSVAVSAGNGSTYDSFLLPDGTACVLQSSYLPHFSSKALDSSLPNPQNLLLLAGCVLSVLSIALIARRASTVISRKIHPLVQAAEKIAVQDLSFHVGGSNVRQIDRVLSSMEAMRSSLEESLRARWDAERAQKDQIASLAHDIKTPLTVLLANAEYVQEEAFRLSSARPVRDGAEAMLAVGQIAESCGDMAVAARRLDAYVRTLVDVSKGQLTQVEKGRVSVGVLVCQVRQDALALAHSLGKEFACMVSQQVEDACLVADVQILARAILNLVDNAARFARSKVSVSFLLDGGSFCVRVEDDGAGFGEEALQRGCERFFQGDPSRSGGHSGLGLYTASQIAKAHGGSLVLRNLFDPEGAVMGACTELRIPISVDRT